MSSTRPLLRRVQGGAEVQVQLLCLGRRRRREDGREKRRGDEMEEERRDKRERREREEDKVKKRVEGKQMKEAGRGMAS